MDVDEGIVIDELNSHLIGLSDQAQCLVDRREGEFPARMSMYMQSKHP